MPQSIFDALPLDVISLALTGSDSAGHSNLRLVCKAFNEIVEPQVFSIVSIEFDEEYKDTIQDKLVRLASGLSPYSRWAKTLQIRRLVPLESDCLEPFEGEEFERMFACQSQWLIPAITALNNVEEVVTRIGTRHPCYDVLCALAKLPLLKSISLSFVDFSEDKQSSIPLALFSNLTSITLRDLYPYPFILESLKMMIAQSPALVDLYLRIYDPEGKSIKFTTLLSSPSTFKELTISTDYILLEPSCTSLLQSLTHLNLEKNSSLIHPSFWKAMQDSGICLEGLDISPLTEPIMGYLLSYAGLKKLAIGWPYNAAQDDGKIRDELFFSILPKHKDTLQVFETNRPMLCSWCFTELYLKQLYLCKNLRQLDVIYYFPSPAEEVLYPTIPLGQLLSSISQNLPRLEALELKMVRKFQNHFGCGNAAQQYYNAIFKYFASTIARTWFDVPNKAGPPRFILEAVNATFCLVEDPRAPGLYRCKMDNPARLDFVDEDLEVEGKVEDWDVEPEAESMYPSFF